MLEFFDSFKCSDFIKERDWDSWFPVTVPIQKSETWTIDCLNHILPEPYFPTKVPNLPPTLRAEGGGIALPNWNSIPDLPDLITINTGFKPTLSTNLKSPYGKEDDDGVRYKYTEEHRAFARKAQQVNDMADFEDKVCVLQFLEASIDMSNQLDLSSLRNSLQKGKNIARINTCALTVI